MGCLSSLSCLGQKRSLRPPALQIPAGKCQQEDGATAAPSLAGPQEGAAPPPPGQLASFLCPPGVGYKSRASFPGVPSPHHLHQLPRQGLGVVLVNVLLLPVLLGRGEAGWGPGNWPGPAGLTPCSTPCKVPRGASSPQGTHNVSEGLHAWRSQGASVPTGCVVLFGRKRVPTGAGCLHVYVHVCTCVQVYVKI